MKISLVQYTNTFHLSTWKQQHFGIYPSLYNEKYHYGDPSHKCMFLPHKALFSH